MSMYSSYTPEDPEEDIFGRLLISCKFPNDVIRILNIFLNTALVVILPKKQTKKNYKCKAIYDFIVVVFNLKVTQNSTYSLINKT